MAQYNFVSNNFLNSNKSIIDVMLIANSTGGIISNFGGSSNGAVSLAAGNNIIGSVLNRTASVTSNLTVNTTIYVANQVVGGLLTFPNSFDSSNSGLLQTLILKSKSVQTSSFVFYLLKGNPTSSTFTDHTVPSIAAADIPLVIGAYPLTSPYSGLGTHSLYNAVIAASIVATSNTMYGVLVTTGTPQFTTVSDVSVELLTIKD